MKNWGQVSFKKLPSFGAKLYESMMQMKVRQIQVREIARNLASKINRGRLLDIGTGPGKLLFEIHNLKPEIELYGLDISNSMVQLAKENLKGVKVDLREGNIERTYYESNFFDIITCTDSFFLWKCPHECLEEIHRILKENHSAYLFETHQDVNYRECSQALKAALQKERLFRRLTTLLLLKSQLKRAYRTDEIADIVKRTSFAHSYTIEDIPLVGVSVWLQIKLTKKPVP